MADLTTEEIAELRRRFEEITPVSWISVHAAIEKALPALLDMAERCAKAEAELAKMRESVRGICNMEDY